MTLGGGHLSTRALQPYASLRDVDASVDVVVVGGGPAGLATAGALARRGASVALFERTAYAAPRVGETLGAEVGPLLRSLGAWQAVEGLLDAQVPFRGVASAWGSAELVERPSILHPLGDGWHVDRAKVDEQLARWAVSEGVAVRADAGACDAVRVDDGFRVSSPRGGSVHGRFLVDASGRGAPATTSLGGRRWLACDRQVALVSWIDAPVVTGVELLLEAAEDGWWYSVPRPDGGLVVVLVTDADLVPAGGRSALPARFSAALARTVHTRARMRDVALLSNVKVVRADSGRLLPDRGPGWRAVGDAAMATDPLAGNGVARALKSALDVADSLSAAADERAVARSFDDFLALRARYYQTETRWSAAPFWARRQPIDWQSAPIELAPDAPLTWMAEPTPHAEALLPPRALAAVRAALVSPQPAHAVLSSIRAIAPLGDRRLLVGLQVLLDEGTLAIA